MSEDRDLLRRDARHLWHPFTQHATAASPLAVVGGDGAWLQLEDGRRILDGLSSWWTNLHGHGHPAISAAIATQAETLDHVLFAGCTHPPAVELAERLVALAPAGLSRVFFSDDGSTAVEVALKMAFQAWIQRGRPEKRGFIALHHGYHGDTVGAMSAGDPQTFGEPFEPLLFPVARIHGARTSPDRTAPEVDGSTEAALGRLEAVLDARADTIAALILEPMVQAAGGMILQPPEFLRGVRALCDRYEVLLIADEVMTGFGRTGRMFAVEHAQISPDLMCLSKGLTGGTLPLSVTMATERIFEDFLSEDTQRGFLHGHSFTANPIACAAAVASLSIFEREPVMARIAAMEAFYAARLPAFLSHPAVAHVRWLGSLGVVELKSADPTYYSQLGPWVQRAFLERGFLVRPLGPVIYTLPPYVTPIASLEALYEGLEELLDALPTGIDV